MFISKPIFLSSYGDENGEHRGIIKLTSTKDGVFQKALYPVDGKANCCIESKDYFFVPVQEKVYCYIYVFRKIEEELQLERKILTTYFYSHGFLGEDECLYLASYDCGVDVILDLKKDQEIAFSVYKKEGSGQGKSHFISYTPDKKYVFSIDCILQQLTLYDVSNHQFELVSILEFGPENIRLMPFSIYSNQFYLNTERSNVLYTIAYEAQRFMIKDKVELLEPGETGFNFSGGNAISADGKNLCVSVRGKNEIQVFDIQKDGTCGLRAKTRCGDMPRDVCFVDDVIAVTCSKDHKIEFYKWKDRFEKVDEVDVDTPVTFSI